MDYANECGSGGKSRHSQTRQFTRGPCIDRIRHPFSKLIRCTESNSSPRQWWWHSKWLWNLWWSLTEVLGVRVRPAIFTNPPHRHKLSVMGSFRKWLPDLGDPGSVIKCHITHDRRQQLQNQSPWGVCRRHTNGLNPNSWRVVLENRQIKNSATFLWRNHCARLRVRLV